MIKTQRFVPFSKFIHFLHPASLPVNENKKQTKFHSLDTRLLIRPVRGTRNASAFLTHRFVPSRRGCESLRDQTITPPIIYLSRIHRLLLHWPPKHPSSFDVASIFAPSREKECASFLFFFSTKKIFKNLAETKFERPGESFWGRG